MRGDYAEVCDLDYLKERFMDEGQAALLLAGLAVCRPGLVPEGAVRFVRTLPHPSLPSAARGEAMAARDVAARAFGPGFASGSDLGQVERAAGLLFDAFVAGVGR